MELGSETEQLVVRVYNKRTLGPHLYFFDGICVGKDERVHVLELKIGDICSNPKLWNPDLLGNEAEHGLRSVSGDKVRAKKPSAMSCTTPSSPTNPATTPTAPPRPTEKERSDFVGASTTDHVVSTTITNASTVKIGDVLLVEGTRDTEIPRYPRDYIFKVSSFRIIEPWATTFQDQKITYAFHPPLFWSEGKRKNGRKTGKKTQNYSDKNVKTNEEKAENGTKAAEVKEISPKRRRTQSGSEMQTTDSAVEGRTKVTYQEEPTKKVNPFRNTPAIILQCHLPLADRIAAYFHGRIASNCTKDRLVYVYDNEQTEQSSLFAKVLLDSRRYIVDNKSYVTEEAMKTLHQNIMEALPIYFHSIIHRIYFVTEHPRISLAEVLERDFNFSGGMGRETSDPTSEERLQMGPKWNHFGSAMYEPRTIQDPKQAKQMCFPREIETRVYERREKQFLITPSKDAPSAILKCDQIQLKCDQIVYADGLYYTGLTVPRIIVPEKIRKDVPSSAYWKLFEIRDRYRCIQASKKGSVIVHQDPKKGSVVDEARSVVDEARRIVDEAGSVVDLVDRSESVSEFNSRYLNRTLAVDIGASPGGWSYCLAKEFKTALTVAVDPAKHMSSLLDPLLVTTSGVEDQKTGVISHWQMKGEVAVEKLKSTPRSLSIFVCDMNDECEKPVELVQKLIKAKTFQSQALIVLTFKNCCKIKSEFHQRKAVQIQKMRDELGIQNIQEIHLFANTALETTVVGELL